MNVNEVIKKIKLMLNSQFAFAEATLTDGTEVYTEGELEVGAILFVRAGEGVSEDPFAPAGMHELTDGKIVTVGENGEITAIDEAAAESVEEDAAEVEMEEVSVVTEVAPEAAEATEDLLVAIAEVIAPFTEEIQALKDEMVELSKKFQKMSAEPAANKVTNTFSEMISDRKKTSEARFEALAKLRKTK